MNKTIIIVGIVVVISIAAAIYGFIQSRNGTNLPTPTPTQTSTSTPTPVSTTHTVTIQNFSFVQASITVKKGDTVMWTNKDSAPHTVVGDGGLSSQTLNQNGAYSFKFNTAGAFSYRCSLHPSMRGMVIVTQ